MQQREVFGIYTITDLAKLGGMTQAALKSHLKRYKGPMQKGGTEVRLRLEELRQFKSYLSNAREGAQRPTKKAR